MDPTFWERMATSPDRIGADWVVTLSYIEIVIVSADETPVAEIGCKD
jgi:hypothetical protein